MTVFADRLDDALQTALLIDGFERAHPRRWVSTAAGPIRRIFEFQALKGATYSARWGFSLDFVPVLRSTRLRWKRTPKSAEFDLCIDPVDDGILGKHLRSLTNLPGYIEATSRDIRRVVAETTSRARKDYACVGTVEDIAALFSERSLMKFQRFSLENYVQTHIAWGLALFAIGKDLEGEAHIGLFCERFGVDRNAPLLRKAEAEAIRCAASMQP